MLAFFPSVVSWCVERVRWKLPYSADKYHLSVRTVTVRLVYLMGNTLHVIIYIDWYRSTYSSGAGFSAVFPPVVRRMVMGFVCCGRVGTAGVTLSTRYHIVLVHCRCLSQLPWGLRRGVCDGSLAGTVGLKSAECMDVCFERCVFSGRGLCVGLITGLEESNRVRCVWVWLWSLDNEMALAHWGLLCQRMEKEMICLHDIIN
jgi:hypothetical protein